MYKIFNYFYLWFSVTYLVSERLQPCNEIRCTKNIISSDQLNIFGFSPLISCQRRKVSFFESIRWLLNSQMAIIQFSSIGSHEICLNQKFGLLHTYINSDNLIANTIYGLLKLPKPFCSATHFGSLLLTIVGKLNSFSSNNKMIIVHKAILFHFAGDPSHSYRSTIFLLTINRSHIIFFCNFELDFY